MQVKLHLQRRTTCSAFLCGLLPAKRTKVTLTIPDVPEAVVVGTSEEEAIASAPSVLESILAGYVLKAGQFRRLRIFAALLS